MNPDLAAILTITVAAGIAYGCWYYDTRRNAKNNPEDVQGLVSAAFRKMGKSVQGDQKTKKGNKKTATK